MTDFPPGTATGIVSERHRTFVGRCAGVLVAVIAASGSVQADAWADFETRCLLPMEAMSDPDVSGLTVNNISTSANGQSSSGFYRDDSDRPWQVMRAADATFCGVRGNLDEHGEIALAVTHWLESAFGDRRYTTIGPLKLQSTDWRSPPLVVEFIPGRGDAQTSLTVGEWQ